MVALYHSVFILSDMSIPARVFLPKSIYIYIYPYIYKYIPIHLKFKLDFSRQSLSYSIVHTSFHSRFEKSKKCRILRNSYKSPLSSIVKSIFYEKDAEKLAWLYTRVGQFFRI